ncbi:Hypothetical protein ETEE_2621 [Edwardsiella anguillarum ET080813]|uniref:Uncharacterized protein n=1 Tax=Edwardsiella anguillarum ET080813 TaxID=667120 RepID=A0A076LQW8_9GAMM|nr:Hypothetical protein ETEE_2621 [Edwardsiella anguillarum ET080813]
MYRSVYRFILLFNFYKLNHNVTMFYWFLLSSPFSAKNESI